MITSFSSAGDNLFESDNFSISCTAMVRDVSFTTLNLTIRDSSDMIANTTVVTSPTEGNPYTLLYSIETLDFLDAGEFTCVAVATTSSNISVSTNQKMDVTGEYYTELYMYGCTICSVHYGLAVV